MSWRSSSVERYHGSTPKSALFLSVATLLNATPVMGQNCSPCGIRLTQVAAIGASEEPGIAGTLGDGAAIDSRGRYWLSFQDPGLRSEVRVFDSSGKLVRVVGKQGRGPGEFIFARIVDVQGDRVYVFDTVQRIVSEYNAEFRLVSSRKFTGSVKGGAVALPSGQFAVNATWGTRERAGYAVHLFDQETALSMDDDPEGYRYDFEFLFNRALAVTSRGTLWSARMDRYLISEFDTQGKRLRTLKRDVSWMPPVTRPVILERDRPPQSFIRSIRADSQGRLWVLISVADPEWRTVLRENPNRRLRDGRPEMEVTDRAKYRDSIIEVFDGRTLRLLARGRTDRPFVRLFGEIHAAYTAIDATGIPRVLVFKLQIVNTEGKR